MLFINISAVNELFVFFKIIFFGIYNKKFNVNSFNELKNSLFHSVGFMFHGMKYISHTVVYIPHCETEENAIKLKKNWQIKKREVSEIEFGKCCHKNKIVHKIILKKQFAPLTAEIFINNKDNLIINHLQKKYYLILGDILFLKDLQIFQDFSIRFINFHRFYGIQVNLGSDFRIMPQCLTDDG